MWMGVLTPAVGSEAFLPQVAPEAVAKAIVDVPLDWGATSALATGFDSHLS